MVRCTLANVQRLSTKTIQETSFSPITKKWLQERPWKISCTVKNESWNGVELDLKEFHSKIVQKCPNLDPLRKIKRVLKGWKMQGWKNNGKNRLLIAKKIRTCLRQRKREKKGKDNVAHLPMQYGLPKINHLGVP